MSLKIRSIISIAELLDYNFTIKYRPGKVNKDADGLSRNPMSVEDMQKFCTKEISPDNTKLLMTASTELCCSAISIDQLELSGQPTESVNRSDLIEEQKSDLVVGPVYHAVALGKRPQKDVWKI